MTITEGGVGDVMGVAGGSGELGRPGQLRQAEGLRRHQQHACEEAGEQAAEVGGEIGGSADGAVDDVVEDEDSCGPGDAGDGGWIEGAAADEEKTEDGAVEAEDGSGGSCADGQGMDGDADEAAGEAGDEVDEQVADAAEDGFDERPDEIEHVHIHADVDDAEVEEAGGEEAPVLVGAEGGGAEVAAPEEDVAGGGLGEGDAAGDHGEEDEGVEGDESDRDGVGIARAGRGGLAGEGFGEGGVVHVFTVLALWGWRARTSGRVVGRLVGAEGGRWDWVVRSVPVDFGEGGSGSGVFDDRDSMHFHKLRPEGLALVHRLCGVGFDEREAAGAVDFMPAAEEGDAGKRGSLAGEEVLEGIFPCVGAWGPGDHELHGDSVPAAE